MIENLPPYVGWLFALTTFLTVAIYLAAVWAAAGRVEVTAGLLVLLLGIHGWLAADGFYLARTVPPRFPLAPLPSTLILLTLFATAHRALASPAALRLLVLVSVVRIPVEIVLWWLFRAGQIPELMTFEGRNFDILSGLSAPIIAWLAFRGGRVNRGLLLAWHVVALGLLVNIVTTAILSLETPFQQLAFEQPNRGVLYFPFIWLPAVIVPVVFVSHLVSLWLLARSSYSRF